MRSLHFAIIKYILIFFQVWATACPAFGKSLLKINIRKIVTSNGCMTYHDINKKLLGPSYQSISQKYDK